MRESCQLDTPIPLAPAVAITTADDDIALTWTHVAQYVNGDPLQVVHYNVLRSTSSYFTPAAIRWPASGPQHWPLVATPSGIPTRAR